MTALAVTDTLVASAGRDATLARAQITAGVPGTAETTTIPTAAVAIMLSESSVRAVTRTGAAIRWSAGPPIVEIDHGVRDGVAIPRSSKWIEAFDDGTYVIAETRARSFDELRAVITSATTYVLAHP